MQKKGKGVLLYLVVAMAVVVALASITARMSKIMNGTGKEFNYSDFISYFDNFQVSEYTLDLDKSKITYKLNQDVEGKEKDKEYTYDIPNLTLFLDDIEDYRQNYNKEHPDAKLVYDQLPLKQTSILAQMLPTIIMFAILGVLFFVLMRQTQGTGKISQFSKVNSKNQGAGNKVTFEDVAGADEEKEELQEVVEFLKSPKKFSELGARIPKGVLLVGPPGTGKTLLAKAVAGEAKAPFFSISGSDFVEMFVGVGASRVRDLFEQAKKNSPSIIFIDEIDAVGRHRGAGLGGGHDEREQTLNQLLVEMDGFAPNQNVIVIAATNRRDILDPALLRPGRFDRQVVVGYPDVKGREEILKVHTKNKPLAPDVELSVIAKTTAGFTGADLENIVNEAALLAARRGRKAITMPDIEEATIKVVAGPEKKSRVVTEKERNLTAFHEAGHAVCTYFCTTQDRVHQISIIPRGMAGGYTMSLPDHDVSFVSKSEMQENIVTLLGGRVAEKLMLDDISTGASNDIERATNVAKSMVKRYGFSDNLGPIVYGHDSNEVFLGRDFSSEKDYSESVAAEIDVEIRNIIESSYESARTILSQNKDKLTLVAQYLLKHEKVDGADFEKLMKGELDLISDDELKQEAKAEEKAKENDSVENSDTDSEDNKTE